MMKRPEFLETKRTPRYSLRKLNERSSKSLNRAIILPD